MTESEIKKWNDEGSYFKEKHREIKRRKRCMILGIISLLTAILWFPGLAFLALWGVAKWGWIDSPPWFNMVFSGVTILQGVISIGIFLYIWFGLLSGRETWTRMEKTGFTLSVISVFFFVAVLLITMMG